MKTQKYKQIKCAKCEKNLDSGMDLVIYNRENGIISQLEFRHGCGKGCDDKSFSFSRHVKDDIDDLLEEWKVSIYNKGNEE